MYVVLWAVLNISTIVKADVVRRERVVANLPFDGVEFIAAIRQHFEECGTPRSRPAENDLMMIVSLIDGSTIRRLT